MENSRGLPPFPGSTRDLTGTKPNLAFEKERLRAEEVSRALGAIVRETDNLPARGKISALEALQKFVLNLREKFPGGRGN